MTVTCRPLAPETDFIVRVCSKHSCILNVYRNKFFIGTIEVTLHQVVNQKILKTTLTQDEICKALMVGGKAIKEIKRN